MTESASKRQRPLRVIAITSGKGGVGKTNLTVNLAVSFADAGRSVLIIDGDVGLANVDILLDESPRHTLHDVVSGKQSVSRCARRVFPRRDRATRDVRHCGNVEPLRGGKTPPAPGHGGDRGSL